MKTEPLRLTLYNFDSEAAQRCSLVLTSPRSLEACRRAGCKPVELLHKSIEEYREDLGVESTEQVYQLYAEQEKDRLSKLELCRAIRRELVDQTCLKENAPPHGSKLCSTEGTGRKAQLDKENSSRAQVSKGAALKTVDNTSNYEENRHITSVNRKVPASTGETTPTSTTDSAINRKPPSSVTTNRNKRATNRFQPKKSVTRRTVFPTPSFVSSLRLSSSSSTASEASFCSVKTVRRSPLPAQSEHGSHIKTPRTGQKSRKQVKSPVTPSEDGRKLNLRDSGIATSYDSNNSSRGSLISPKRKQVKFSYLSADNLYLSEHDRRILESMALKKELERESEQVAHEARLLWERDREQRVQLNGEQAARWREYVAEKRRRENEDSTRRWEEMKNSLRESQMQLEHNIKAKEQRAEILRREIGQRKMSEAEERSWVVAKRRAEVEAANQQMDLETAVWQQSLGRQQRDRLERAESTRSQYRESYRRRVASANRVEELRHQDRWQLVQAQTEAALEELRTLCQLREQRAQEKYCQLLEERDRHIKEQNLERQLQSQQVRELHNDLERGLQQWQKQVLNLQWEATQRAEQRATLTVEGKRQRVEMENRARERHHRKLMERISREDDARMQYIRELISRKEEKMRRMAEERDLAIQESRLQAQTTADLREHLRRTLSPETFDRKVARIALEMRVAGRPPTASPTMSRSHIVLG